MQAHQSLIRHQFRIILVPECKAKALAEQREILISESIPRRRVPAAHRPRLKWMELRCTRSHWRHADRRTGAVAAQVARLEETIGVDTLLLMCSFGTLTHVQVCRSLEYFVQAVIHPRQMVTTVASS